jgi:hypothetical protein
MLQECLSENRGKGVGTDDIRPRCAARRNRTETWTQDVRSWMQRCQTDGLGGTVQHHSHLVHRTLHLGTFLWGYTKDKVHSTPFPDIGTLNARIKEDLAAVTEDTLEKSSIDKIFSGPLAEHMLKCTNVASKRNFMS